MATIFGSNNNDPNLTGSAADDLILGFQGDDTLQGNGGADTLVGGQGADSIQFGSATAANATTGTLIYGDEGADSIASAGSSASNTIIGDTGNAAIDATQGGNDFIDVTRDSGADIVLGNYGDDTVIGSTVLGGASGPAFGQTGPAYPIYVGGQGNDLITSGDVGEKAGPVVILGNQGNDTVEFNDSAATVVGGLGNDTIRQFDDTTSNDLIYGSEGNDVIFVFGGNNTILGGTGNAAIDSQANAAGDGNDSIVVGAGVAGSDFILGNFGDDTIDASAQVAGGTGDTLVGGQGNDVVRAGRTANNLIFGNEGNDVIVDTLSGAGTDTIAGGSNDDTITAGITSTNANDLIYGNEGNNLISIVGPAIATGTFGGQGRVTVGSNDTIYGGNSANDLIGGGDGNNTITVLSQGFGNDLIYGGPGDDSFALNGSVAGVTQPYGTVPGALAGVIETVTGGAGADIFRYTASSVAPGNAGTQTRTADNTTGTTGLDTITDFVTGVDKIALNTASTPQSVVDVTTSAGTTTAGSLAAAAAGADARISGPAGTKAATFAYGGDHYLLVETNTTANQPGRINLLIDIKGTTSLATTDFTV